jgi:glycosyltransferase involved in cell wall biosynthesis
MAQVSVIIPTYNRAQFLAGAVQSVLTQSFKDLEIIVVDDGGSDAAEAVVKGFPDAPIRYLRHARRQGGAAARNTGIQESSGEYVAFLDDDDEWYPEKLARQMHTILASPPEVGGVYTGYFIVDRADGKIHSQMVPTERGDIHSQLLARNCIGSTSSMLLRRSCFDKVGMFDERLQSFQDYDLWIRLARRYQFEFVREPLLKYFVHGEKIWTNSEALTAGLDLMLKKYGYAPAFRRKCSGYYLSLGVQYCDNSRFHAGRRALLRAVRLSPFAMKTYYYLGLALLGAAVFRGAQRAKARLLASRQRPPIEVAENA